MTLPRKSRAKAAAGSLGLPSACRALPVARESRRIMLRWLDERFSRLAMLASMRARTSPAARQGLPIMLAILMQKYYSCWACIPLFQPEIEFFRQSQSYIIITSHCQYFDNSIKHESQTLPGQL